MNWFERMFRTGNERTDTPGVSLRLSPGHSRSVLAMFIATALLLTGAHSAGAATNYTAAAATFSWVALLLGVFALIYNDEFNRDLFNAGGHDDGDQYRALQGQKSRWLSYQLKLQSFFNDYAWPLRTADGLCKAEEGMRQGLRELRLSLPFLVASFSGVYKDACYQEYYTQHAKSYSYGNREPFKEVTREAYGKNSFAQISYDFGNKFSAGVVNDCLHWLDNITSAKQCQAQLRREMGHELV